MALKMALILLFVAILSAHYLEAAVLHKRDTNSTGKQLICQNSTPCGWAVYNQYTRVIQYFMQNECICPEEKKCIRTDDDISVTAYVYRCRA